VLAHPNGHWRDMAQRMIVASGSPLVVPALRRLTSTHDDARVRLHALWTLDGLGAVNAAVLESSLGDASPHVRIAALRIAEALLADERLRRAAVALADDQEVAVRRQLLYTLGASTRDDVHAVRMRLLRRDLSQPFFVDAFVSGLAGRERQTLRAVLGSEVWVADRPEHRALVLALATAVANEGRPDGLETLRRVTDEASVRPSWQREAVIDGMKLATHQTQAASPPGARADAATAARVEQGRTAFAICAACHQADGRGLPALAPPLSGSAVVNGPASALIDVVLHGRDVDPAYPSMPPLAGLSDDQLAAILTYVRTSWGNAAPPVTADAVRTRRTAPRP
jgi:mono/diheme cytochrome c family protein